MDTHEIHQLTTFEMHKKMIGEDETLHNKSKVDLSRLPPCKDSLYPHIQRVNYRLACYKRAFEPIFENWTMKIKVGY